MVAKTMVNLEEVLAEELRQMGALNVTPITRAVEFEGDISDELLKETIEKEDYTVVSIE